MRLILENKKRKNFAFKLIIIFLLFYILSLFINQQIALKKQKNIIKNLSESIYSQEIKNQEIFKKLENYNSHTDQNVEELARERLQMIKPGEKVFFNVLSN